MTDKLTHIHDRIYCCRSGSAADTQAVADIVHQHAQLYTSIYNEPPPVHTVAALFEKLCYENKDQLSAGIIVAGWDKENGGGVFNVPLGGGIFQQPWAIGGELFGPNRSRRKLIVGSGSTYVYGYCDATYREGWSEEETVKFVKNSTSHHSKRQTLVLILALALAMARDGSSGGTIRMCVITKDKVERHFVPGNELPKFWEGKEIIGQAAHPVTVGA